MRVAAIILINVGIYWILFFSFLAFDETSSGGKTPTNPEFLAVMALVTSLPGIFAAGLGGLLLYFSPRRKSSSSPSLPDAPISSASKEGPHEPDHPRPGRTR